MEKEDSSRASIDVSFFSLSFFFFLQRRHAILCRDSFSTDRSRNFEKWEFWDVECNGNNAFLFFFFSFEVENLRFDGVLGNDRTVALNRITIFLREIGDWK